MSESVESCRPISFCLVQEVYGFLCRPASAKLWLSVLEERHKQISVFHVGSDRGQGIFLNRKADRSKVFKPAVHSLYDLVLMANGRSFPTLALVVLVQIVGLLDIDPPTLGKGLLQAFLGVGKPTFRGVGLVLCRETAFFFALSVDWWLVRAVWVLRSVCLASGNLAVLGQVNIPIPPPCVLLPLPFRENDMDMQITSGMVPVNRPLQICRFPYGGLGYGVCPDMKFCRGEL